MNRVIFLAGAAVAVSAIVAGPAVAQQAETPRFTLGVTAGSLGIGPEAGVRVAPLFGVRASASFLDFSHGFNVNDIDYNGKVKLRSYGGNIDLYPFSNGFRLSGGFRIDRNKVDVTATPTGSVTVGNASFTPAQIGTISGTVTTDEFAPTVTIGYSGGLTKGIKFSLDAGAMFQGSPRVDKLTSNGTLANDPTYQAQLLVEQQDLNDKASDYKVYPIVQVAVFYAF